MFFLEVQNLPSPYHYPLGRCTRLLLWCMYWFQVAQFIRILVVTSSLMQLVEALMIILPFNVPLCYQIQIPALNLTIIFKILTIFWTCLKLLTRIVADLESRNIYVSH